MPQTTPQANQQEAVYSPVDPTPERVAVRVGASLHPNAVAGQLTVLAVPPRDRLLKAEDRVLAWPQALADGTPAFFKLYTRRPRRVASKGVRTSIRVCREFDRLSRMEEAGISCTRPLFWGRGSSPTLGRVEVLATRLVEDATPLRRALRERPALAEELDWKELLSQVGAMHAAGVHHSALSPKNVLVDRAGRFHLCDLASSMRYPASISGTRMALFDLVHLMEGLGKLLGPERRREILLAGTGDAGLTERVLAKASGYRRRQMLQHQRLRAEFHLRNVWAWSLGRVWTRTPRSQPQLGPASSVAGAQGVSERPARSTSGAPR
jgi:hypothetical protein